MGRDRLPTQAAWAAVAMGEVVWAGGQEGWGLAGGRSILTNFGFASDGAEKSLELLPA